MKMKKNISIGILFPLGWIVWAFLYYKILFLHGSLIPLDDAAKHLWSILFQHTIVNLPAWFLLIWGMKTSDKEEFFFCIPDKIIGKVFLGLAMTVYLSLLVYGFQVNREPMQVLYVFLFYLLMISLLEEYIYRGVVPALLKNNVSKWAVWIIPNTLFTFSHFIMVFVDDDGMKGIAISSMIFFFFSTMFFGILMEWIKRRFQSLWIIILIHAIYDFYGEIMLWIQ